MFVASFVSSFVSSSLFTFKVAGEWVLGHGVESVFSRKFSVHSVLSEEPLELVNLAINNVLEVLILTFKETGHVILGLLNPLDEFLSLELNLVIADFFLVIGMILVFLSLFLKEISPPLSDNNELVKERVFSVVKLVVGIFFVSIEHLNKWVCELFVINIIDGFDGIVVEIGNVLSVNMELLEDLVFILIELCLGADAISLELILKSLPEDLIGELEEAVLGLEDLLVVEHVVSGNSILVLDPLLLLVCVKCIPHIRAGVIEFHELLNDLSLDGRLVFEPVIGIELLGEERDLSPEGVFLRLKVVGNEFSSISGGSLDVQLVFVSLCLQSFTDELDTFTE